MNTVACSHTPTHTLGACVRCLPCWGCLCPKLQPHFLMWGPSEASNLGKVPCSLIFSCLPLLGWFLTPVSAELASLELIGFVFVRLAASLFVSSFSVCSSWPGSVVYVCPEATAVTNSVSGHSLLHVNWEGTFKCLPTRKVTAAHICMAVGTCPSCCVKCH